LHRWVSSSFLTSQRSPDGAQRNRGRAIRLAGSSRISLRSIPGYGFRGHRSLPSSLQSNDVPAIKKRARR
jgi:hypothetical protein